MNDHENNHRVVPLTGACNFRDLGGYSNGNGKQVKWNLLYRSDQLTELTESDVEKVNALALNRILDLRIESEIQRAGYDSIYTGNEGKYDFLQYNFGDPHLMHAEVESGLEWDIRKVDFGSIYINILECNREGIKLAFDRFADPAQYPILLHCTQGKDRSGVVSALLLLLLGIPESTVMEDYMLTDAVMDIEKGMIAIQGYLETSQNAVPDGITAEDWRPMLTCVPEAMKNLVTHLRTEYNGVEGFLESIGVSVRQRQIIQNALLKDLHRN